jgi:superfamily I DNA and/or RNA helicase
MEFLYSLNRLNVATSRAKCLSIVVASPQLLEAECRTPRQIQLVNAFCRFVELSQRVGGFSEWISRIPTFDKSAKISYVDRSTAK